MELYHVRPKVYISREIPFPAIGNMSRLCDISVCEGEEGPATDELIHQVSEVDAILCLVRDRIDRHLIDAAPHLKIISTMSVGFEHIDVDYATRKGIYVGYTPDVLTDATADLAFALLLAAGRRVAEGDRFVRKQEWKVSWTPLFFVGKPVWGSTLGIIGLGKIGKAVAKRASGFNMRILYNNPVRLDPEEEKQLCVSYASSEELLEESDFVSVHAPATEKTRHFINEECLRRMKRTAILVNTSRGSLVDEKALIRALRENWIAGAGLDVYEKEPVAFDNPLLDLDNVVLVPHIGSATMEARSRMSEIAAKNIISVLSGEAPPCLLNPEVMSIRPLSAVKML